MHTWNHRDESGRFTLMTKERKLSRFVENYWSKVERRPPDKCWEWTASKNGKGYGQIRRLGKLYYANRVAWELAYGSIPKGMCVLHRCDNPSCVNPKHLFLGTPKTNSEDMVSKGRSARGQRARSAKLIPTDVQSIRLLKGTQREVARIFGIDQSTVSNIRTKKSWGWLK